MDIEPLLDEIERSASIRIARARVRPVSGGSIDRAYRLEATPSPVFAKIGARATLPMFEVEAMGLTAMRDAGGVRVPDVLAVGNAAAGAFLVLEWIDLAAGSSAAERALGRGLARLHRATAEQYGWTQDNRIGATPQHNAPSPNWAAFFRERRLRYQLDLAAARGLPIETCQDLERLLDDLDLLVGEHPTQPSLVHGDLWGGNWGTTRGEEPVLFDPAVYYGDREVDLAMTRLFGGFGPAFYEAYDAEWPVPPGSERRAVVYNLYHLLNHYNLFGRSYLTQIDASLGALGLRR